MAAIQKVKNVFADPGSKKVGIVAFLGIAACAVYVFSGTEEVPVPPSTLAKAPISNAPAQGGTILSPSYTAAVKQDDERRINEAREKGTSAMPTVILGAPAQQTPLLVEEKEEEPPAPPEVPTPKEPVIEQRPVIAMPVQPAVPIVAPPPPVQNPQDIQRMSEAVASIARRPYPVAEVQYLYDAQQAPATTAPTQSAPSVPAQAASTAQKSRIKVPLAGEILYAQLVGRANSDAPGPVIAKILQGPYAGATLVGSFQTRRDSLTIQFSKMTVHTTADGEEINETVDINAVAVDTKHIGTALATSVDRHLFEKLAISLASSFAEGFGRVISQRNTTTTYRSDGSYTSQSAALSARDELLAAGGHAIAQTGNILMDEFGRRPTTIIVDAETPIGVLFL
jgi:Bacterial conjugation TrbI-like protein.